MKTIIRPALTSDTPALIDLSRRTISASYRPFLGDRSVDEFLESGAADDYVRVNLDRCSIIVCDRRVAGYAVCRENLIDLMMIDHTLHRRGLGTELLQWVEQAQAEHGELRLESFAANEPANAFYRKNGWIDAGRCFDRDAGVDKILFRKPTASSPPRRGS